MALLTEAEVRRVARQKHAALHESYNQVLAKAAQSADERFDIFLSHSIKDAELVQGVHLILKQLGYSVYVDWIVDRDLDRQAVSPSTAVHLRKRMRQCTSLLYLATDNSSVSRWMPWELGFFDGHSSGRVAILPVSKEKRDGFEGQEYLGVYPYVDVDAIEGTQTRVLWTNRAINRYASFDKWLLEGNRAITQRM